MRSVSTHSLIMLIGLIVLLSWMVFFINSSVYHFPGNNYFPEGIYGLALLLIIFNLGLRLYYTKSSRAYQSGRELLYFFAVMYVIALATNAVQLTPFTTIDKKIVALEPYLHSNMDDLLHWTHTHPHFKRLLAFIYDTLPYQMSLLPLLVIVSGRFYLLREYYFLLLCTTLLGFTFYYFFPTTAPASIIKSPVFSPDQIATGLKFYQIHHHIQPTTNKGGLIALPSFHAIWAILCLGLLREWTIPFVLLLMVNTLLITSCVLLGWHYCLDMVGSFLVLILSYYFLACNKKCG